MYSFKRVARHGISHLLEKTREPCFHRALQLLRLSRKLSCVTITEPGAKDLAAEKSLIRVMSCINGKNSEIPSLAQRGKEALGFQTGSRCIPLPNDSSASRHPVPHKAARTYLQSVHRASWSIEFLEQEEKQRFAAAHLPHSLQLKERGRAQQTLSKLGGTLFNFRSVYDIYYGPLLPSPLPPQ